MTRAHQARTNLEPLNPRNIISPLDGEANRAWGAAIDLNLNRYGGIMGRVVYRSTIYGLK
jgi:hypothetical protein